MKKDLTGIAVQSRGGEHGEEIIETFKKLGVDTGHLQGYNVSGYYGFELGGEFCHAKYGTIFTNIITLEELKSYLQPEFPRVVWAWDDVKEKGKNRVMIAYDENLEKPVVVYADCERIEDIKKGKMDMWNYKHFCELSDYRPKLTYNGKEVTKDEMLKLLGREV